MIYIDVSAAAHSRAGLGRYAEHLAKHIHATAPDQYKLFFNRGRHATLPSSLQNIPHHSHAMGYKPWRMAVLMAHLSGRGFNAMLPDLSLFHSTEHLLFPVTNKPTILTIHDLIFNLFPQYHKKLNYWFLNWAVPIFCKRATHLIAVSESSKRDVVQQYQIDPNKVTVVYEAASELFQPPSAAHINYVRQQYQLPQNFLLHIGTIEPRKNLDRLLDAFNIVRRDHPTVHLLLAGAKGWLMDAFFARIEQEGLSDVVRPLGWMPDVDLPAVIAAASLAIQPSLYEGFGLPILEHMACGQVVAASNVASHPEVGGEAAIYFDPINVDQMATVMNEIMGSADLYQHHQQLSIAQAAHFSWERTAAQTIDLYDQLLISSG